MKFSPLTAVLALLSAPALAQHEGHGPAPEAEESIAVESPRPEATAGALGPYPATRESSGTTWQPEATPHAGAHVSAGRWSLMGHATLFGVYDWQGGPRGGEKGFLSGMAMGSARRPLGAGTLQLRASLSPDALMGRSGYPLLLASGETANGEDPLVDRQHPHDLFMELSVSYGVALSSNSSLFVYAGLPGEPAFGPPPFMHRVSAMASPEAPISHHWLDSTHISFGVVTAGIVVGKVKLEGSRFNGREPDHRRFDIETGPLDSSALRISWNPLPHLALQASWARLISPEQLEPGENSTRWSASALYAKPLGRRARWSTTLAWGRRSGEHQSLDAFVLETAFERRGWTLFGRAERTENDELGAGSGHHGPVFAVGKASLGVLRDFRIVPHARLGIGASWAFNFVPAGLEPAYAGDRNGAMVFVRATID